MNDIIQRRLDDYGAVNAVEEEQALKEIIQEIALYALWRADFYRVAAFQGGTSLRVLHGLPRFSEDLDFVLQQPPPAFDWSAYLERLVTVFAEYGIRCEALPRGRVELSFYKGHRDRKLRIKLEIDVNPPAGSGFDYSYLDFPTDYEICHQDLGSNFALKIHALLCRGHLKGRDWYDFGWYIRQRVEPNLPLLQNALVQAGPWAGQSDLAVDRAWLSAALQAKIDDIDWADAARDVAPFLQVREQESLQLWNARFFSQKLAKLR